MGITIFYRGQISDVNLIYDLTHEIGDIASIMKWKYHIWDDDWSISPSATIENKGKGCHIKGHLGLKGISFLPHQSCEEVNLTFDKSGILFDPIVLPLILNGTIEKDQAGVSVKTQFAGTGTHIVIIKLLKYIKKRYIPDLYVFDEGEYWQKEDRRVLEEKISGINRAMDLLEDALSKVQIDDSSQMTGEDICLQIEQILKDKFGFSE